MSESAQSSDWVITKLSSKSVAEPSEGQPCELHGIRTAAASRTLRRADVRHDPIFLSCVSWAYSRIGARLAKNLRVSSPWDP
jgi:hypothetical protein